MGHASEDETSQRPLAILSAPGSRGDLNPMVAIGAELKNRGFDVAISLAEPYVDVALQAGLTPYPIIDRASFQSLVSDPALWNIVRGMHKVLSGIAADFLEPHFELIQRIHRPGKTVLISHPLDFSSRIFRDWDETTPLVDVQLAPVMLRVKADPPRLTPWPLELLRFAPTFDLAYALADTLVLDRILARPINRIRRRVGLRPVRRIMHQWWLSPDRILACYPSWFAPATEGFLPQLRHVGFPLHDASEADVPIPPGRPIVFTAGSANHHAKTFFGEAVAACEQLQLPGILLGPDEDCFPTSLPSDVLACGYVPLGKLLPCCRCIVHHGGIGTTSQALRAGIPQIVRPLAFDQFDNAQRVRRLGVGKWLGRRDDLIACMQNVLSDSQLQANASERARNWPPTPAAELAADEIESAMAAAVGKPAT